MARVVLVVPCYEEADRLDLEAFVASPPSAHDLRYLFVDDGSTDRTGALLEELDRRASHLTVMALPRNVGKAEAVRRGVMRALRDGPDYVGYWDADLSTPLEVVDDFCRLLESDPELGAVIGARVRLLGRRIERKPVRHYAGRLFATAASLAISLPVYDTQCGAKLFRAGDAVREAFATPFRSRWIFDVELLARLTSAGGRGESTSAFTIREHPLPTWIDVPPSHLRIRDFVRAGVDLARIWWRHRDAASRSGREDP